MASTNNNNNNSVMAMLLLLVFFYLLGLACGANMTLFTLTDHPDDSACLDGSPYAYYFRAGNSSTKWVIHHQGGGWCTDIDSCYGRASTVLGTSSLWASSIPSWLGILDDDPVANPDYHDWNAVILFYCDGTSFSGFRADPVPYNGKNIFFKGKNNLIAASNDLLATKGLDAATDVIITGCSAGGLSTYVHTDWWRGVVRSEASVHGIGDAGWFLDAPSFASGVSIYTPEMQSGFELWNSTNGLHQGCVAAYTPSNEVWKCLFAEYIYPYIKTPIFVVNSKNDNWQIHNILNLPCSGQPSTCNATEMEAFHNYAKYYLTTVAQVANSSKDGMFVSACYTHCQTIDDTAWTKTFSQTEDGTKVSPSIAFTNWYNGQKETKAIDTGDYPCNPTCQSY